jgi:hypothetical protein
MSNTRRPQQGYPIREFRVVDNVPASFQDSQFHCPDCDSDVVRLDSPYPRWQISHDDTCPTLAAKEANPRTPKQALLDALQGRQVPGGCADCDAVQVVDQQDGVYVITVRHDDTCPYYLGQTR